MFVRSFVCPVVCNGRRRQTCSDRTGTGINLIFQSRVFRLHDSKLHNVRSQKTERDLACALHTYTGFPFPVVVVVIVVVFVVPYLSPISRLSSLMVCVRTVMSLLPLILRSRHPTLS